MKKISFITFFITIHFIFIFLQVHKHTLFIKNNYNQQLYEKKIITLKEKQQKLIQELHALKDRDAIKQFAQNKLRMRPYTLNQIIKLSENNDSKL
jgi:cell division protein FtsL